MLKLALFARVLRLRLFRRGQPKDRLSILAREKSNRERPQDQRHLRAWAAPGSERDFAAQAKSSMLHYLSRRAREIAQATIAQARSAHLLARNPSGEILREDFEISRGSWRSASAALMKKEASVA